MASISIMCAPGRSEKPAPDARRQHLWRCLRRGVRAMARCSPGLPPDAGIRAMVQDTLRYFDSAGVVADRVRSLVEDEILEACERSEPVYTEFRNTNGLKPHCSCGYLVHSEVGAVIGRRLRGDG